MKLTGIFLTFLSLLGLGVLAYGQQQCKVLLPEIADSYEGECKKGLAHGEGIATGIDKYEGTFRKGLPHGSGTYTWSTGESYTGGLITGLMNGPGVLVLKVDGKDSLVTGIWKNDEYLGPPPDDPLVLGKENIEKYSFTRLGDQPKVMVDILLYGMPNTTIQRFSMAATSGNQIQVGRYIGYDNVIFPVLCKISYITWDDAPSSLHYTRFEFEISEPGDWLVVIHN